ncbi:Hypothetical predicted protein [Cloeon dipterum]|uniref:Uncharacterized protein n=1 Tax=Cloeon dipterum TaxID=197152 RepID=A0A8S1C436_9INSE|nr:Hypothetical predicted protein [Cloeon dipterum]
MLLSGIGTIHWDAFIFMGAGISASGFIIFAVCSASHQLSCKIKTDFVEAIQVTKKLRASKPTIKAINKLLLHLIEISPPLNLDGYMTIDRSLLTTVSEIPALSSADCLSLMHFAAPSYLHHHHYCLITDADRKQHIFRHQRSLGN